jgi:integrase
VSASTQNQALQALLFFHRHVLNGDLPWIEGIVRARTPRRLPVVLTRREVVSLLEELHGHDKLIAGLMYGSGLRVQESLRLRVKDLDLPRRELVVRDGKRGKDRVTVLPASLIAPLTTHLRRLRRWHDEQRRMSLPGVSVPDALQRKYPNARSAGLGSTSSRAAVSRGSHAPIYTHVLNRGGRGVRSPLDRGE